MIEIKNLMFQPLAFHLAGKGEGLHLKPRERRKIEDGQISPEIEMAEKRGFISIKRDVSEESAESTAQAAGAKKAKSKTKKTTKKKRS